MITRISQWLIDRISEVESALFRLASAVLFAIAQGMSFPCSRWFYEQCTETPHVALLFAIVSEAVGGYAGFTLMERITANARERAGYRKRPIWLAGVATAISIVYEGFLVWAYTHRFYKNVPLLTKLKIPSLAMLAGVAYALSLIGVLVAGIEAQTVAVQHAIARRKESGQSKAQAGTSEVRVGAPEDMGKLAPQTAPAAELVPPEAEVPAKILELDELPPHILAQIPVSTAEGPQPIEPQQSAPVTQETPAEHIETDGGPADLTRAELTPMVLQLVADHPELDHKPTAICRTLGLPLSKRTMVGRILKGRGGEVRNGST